MKNQSKSDFIRAQPPELSAAEVVKRAKAAGIELTAQLVYVIRSVARRKQTGGGRRGRPSALVTATRGRGRPSNDPSRQFVALVTDIGLFRAEQLLAEFRARSASIRLA